MDSSTCSRTASGASSSHLIRPADPGRCTTSGTGPSGSGRPVGSVGYGAARGTGRVSALGEAGGAAEVGGAARVFLAAQACVVLALPAGTRCPVCRRPGPRPRRRGPRRCRGRSGRGQRRSVMTYVSRTSVSPSAGPAVGGGWSGDCAASASYERQTRPSSRTAAGQAWSTRDARLRAHALQHRIRVGDGRAMVIWPTVVAVAASVRAARADGRATIDGADGEGAVTGPTAHGRGPSRGPEAGRASRRRRSPPRRLRHRQINRTRRILTPCSARGGISAVVRNTWARSDLDRRSGCRSPRTE